MSVASPPTPTVTAAPAVAPPAPPRRAAPLNLARRPFVNTRPVVRVALLLWVLGGLLLLGNVSLFWRYLSGSGEMRAELDRMEGEVHNERQKSSELRKRIEGYDLGQQNEQVEYLNRKIAERTFSWSLLFDRIAEVLPDNVRLTRLAPTGIVAEEKGGEVVRRSGRKEDDDRALLTITGVAKNDEALSRFVDNLYRHPAFEDPNPTQEKREEGGLLEFNLTVYYQPAGVAAAGVVTPGRREPSMVLEEGTPPPAPPADTGGGQRP
ncbi:MAG TPA: PilN domain-containing protein [Thermoanaerobaculia bacterium]|nr:PilN domain-containing protein [Thermoanaerobaculia bacterium]